MSMDIAIRSLLEILADKKGSDLHLTVGVPPMVRVDGTLLEVEGYTPLTPPQIELIAKDIVNAPGKWEALTTQMEVDFSFGIEGVGRFRVNAYHQRGSLALAIRLIPFEPWPLRALGLPQVLEELALKPQGFILVAGPTGSGKSTTLASLVDAINQAKRAHIVTIEDPIEYLHRHRRSVVNQREIGQDSVSFPRALRSVLREDPDVVLIGEMRDLESIEAALHIAETGHMVFSTLHTNSAVQTINRVIDVFPPHQQAQVRTQLSFVLDAVLCQRLLPKVGGGRVMVYEFLVATPAVRNLIREGKAHQIYSQMQMGQEKTRMVTMSQMLAEAFARGTISEEDALYAASDAEEFYRALQLFKNTKNNGPLLRGRPS